MSPPLRAELIASWNFNDSDQIVDQGAGALTTNFPAADISYAAGTTRNALNEVVAGQALTVRNQANNGAGYLDFAINTTGYTGLVFSMATQRTATGFNNNQLAYSTNGGTSFTSFGTPYNPAASFDVVEFDMTAITGLDQNPNAMFRILFSGATSATGNNRLDNVVVQGTHQPVSVPEPPAWLMTWAAGGLLALGRKSHRLQLRSAVIDGWQSIRAAATVILSRRPGLRRQRW
jgi:hypothetical protein